jgi:hypothetical protein
MQSLLGNFPNQLNSAWEQALMLREASFRLSETSCKAPSLALYDRICFSPGALNQRSLQTLSFMAPIRS